MFEMQTALACAVVAVGLSASPAFALDVEKSIEVAASPEEAWQALADFCSIAVWHPGIAACEQSEQDGATLGTLTTGDGGVVLEKLIEHDDQAMSFTYTILESPLPVTDYVSTMNVSPASGGASINWRSEFSAKGTSDEEAIAVISEIYDAGLASLQSKLAQ
jgi:hypothetical protein